MSPIEVSKRQNSNSKLKVHSSIPVKILSPFQIYVIFEAAEVMTRQDRYYFLHKQLSAVSSGQQKWTDQRLLVDRLSNYECIDRHSQSHHMG